MDAVDDILARAGITLDELAYVGDDVVDLPVMRVCGLAIATANARHPGQGRRPLHHAQRRRPRRRTRRHRLHPRRPGQTRLQAIEAFLDADNPAAAAADIGTGRM
jgi:3-deoxy-D-manno-octulosonate 8-phosphate phosphatase (KDO 8-P phosphatase)